jgi:hypothetical protein
LKEEIEEFLRESEEVKKEDPTEARLGIKIALLGYILMIPGTIIWLFIYFNGRVFSFPEMTLNVFLGSFLVGVTGFLISIGSSLYFDSPRRIIKTHWVFKGVFRTFLQLYSWFSFIVIFFTVRRFFLSLTIDFIILFIILSIPSMLGYSLAHWSRMRDAAADLVFKLGK